MNSENGVDNYLAKSEAFAFPILTHLRKIVHDAIPRVEEQLKWGFPHFMYKGKILCSMASFKQHCAFGFWLSKAMEDPDGILDLGDERSAMGNLGQLRNLSDLPPDVILKRYILQAAGLIDSGVKLPAKEKGKERAEIEVPDYFRDLLAQHPASMDFFESLSKSHQREYLEWITGAKTEPTRLKRLQTAVEWLSERKPYNWKYMQKKKA